MGALINSPGPAVKHACTQEPLAMPMNIGNVSAYSFKYQERICRHLTVGSRVGPTVRTVQKPLIFHCRPWKRRACLKLPTPACHISSIQRPRASYETPCGPVKMLMTLSKPCSVVSTHGAVRGSTHRVSRAPSYLGRPPVKSLRVHYYSLCVCSVYVSTAVTMASMLPSSFRNRGCITLRCICA